MNKHLTDQQIAVWSLFITVHSRLIAKFETHLAQAEQIPLHWYDVLIELYEAPMHRLRMRDLAHNVVLSRSGLTRLVDNLEKEGLLQRQDDPDDRRGSYAVITDKGIVAMRAAWPIYAKLINDYFIQQLSEADAVLLSQIFQRLIDNSSN